MTAEQASALAKDFAERMERELPRLVVSRMTKSLRPGKVLIDWSQNNGSKTTVAPYSPAPGSIRRCRPPSLGRGRRLP